MFWRNKYFNVVATLIVGISLLVFPNPEAQAQAASPTTFENSDVAGSLVAPLRQANQENQVALDPSLDSLIQSKIEDNGHVKVDLFVMSQCPFGVMAEQALIPKVTEWGKPVEFNLYFIASEDGNGGFTSLHGQAEVDEDIRQVVIAKYYPDQLLNYILARSADSETDWQQQAAGLGIDTARVQQIALSEEGKDLLRANIQLGNDLNIGASPTLFVDDEEYAGAIFAIPDTTSLGDTTLSTPDTIAATSSDGVTNSGSTATTGWLLFALVALVSLGLAGLIFWFRLRRLGAGTSLRQQWPLLTGLLILVVVVVAGSYGLWLKPTYFAGTVTGQVLDAETDAPIEGASVTIHGTRFVTQTDANGEYLFAKVPMGVRIVVARQAGFTLDAQEVNIVGGQAAESLTLYLTRLEPPTVIGTTGGIIQAQGGITLTIPAGALSTDTEITVTPLQPEKAPNLVSLYLATLSEQDEQTQPDGRISILMAVEFGPEGTTFSKPVTVSFTLPSTAPEDLNIFIFQMDSKTLLWSLLETVSVQKGESTLSFQANHFSPYAATTTSSGNWCTGVPDLWFTDACHEHDVCYDTCGKPKSQCDTEFLTNMKNACAYVNILLWDKCYAMAIVYYEAVHHNVLGIPQKRYDAAQKNCCGKVRYNPLNEICCRDVPEKPYVCASTDTCCFSACCTGNEVCLNRECSTIGQGSLPNPFASPGAVVQQVSSQGGMAAFDDNVVQVSLPPEAVTGTVNLVYMPQTAFTVSGFDMERLFSLEAYTGGCQWKKFTDFSKPVSIQVSYFNEQIIGMDESQLGLYYFNNDLNQWVALPSIVDPAMDTVTVSELKYFTLNATLYALMAPTAGAH